MSTTWLTDHPRVAARVGVSLGWHTVRHEAEVTSTNDVAMTMVAAGTPPGFVVVADHQRAGRGRRGDAWDDRSDGDLARSLTASFVVPAPREDASLVPLAVGLALVDTLGRLGADAVLKWPNDVLVEVEGGGPGKCAGILVERHPGADGRDVLVVGTGVNLDWRDVERTGGTAAWTSVAEAVGHEVDRGVVLGDLMETLAWRLRAVGVDPGGLLDDYRSVCVTLGQRVRVSLPGDAVLVGDAVGIGDDGRLALATSSGTTWVTAGEVHHVRPVRPRGSDHGNRRPGS